MPRKGHIPKRDVLADPVYNNKVVTKLINNIMLDGKKGTAQKIVYGAFEKVAEKSGRDAVEVFEEAMNNIMPVLEVKARRIGGATYQVPVDVRPERRQALALRWLTMFSRKEEKRPCRIDWRMKSWMLQIIQVQPLREKKICIRWQRQIKHLLIIDGNYLNIIACSSLILDNRLMHLYS